MDPFYSLGFLLNRTSVSLSKALNAKLEIEKIDLPHSQFIALRCLYYNDGISQQEIARLLSKDAAAIKRTIDNLENKGLIIRNQTSLRENSIEITSEGKQLMPIVLRYADQVLKESLNGIDNLKYDELVSMLNQIYDNTKKSK